MSFLSLYSDRYLLGMTFWLLAGAVGLWLMVTRWRRFKEVPKRRLLIQIGLFVWMFMAAITVLELYFAVFYDTTDSFNMTNVSRKWYKLHADTQMKRLVFANGEWFPYRDNDEFPKSIGANRRRICFCGDSFTFGHGIADISDRFSNLIGTALEEKHGDRFVVTNLASVGIDLHWILRYG